MSFRLPHLRSRVARELDDELAFHVTMRAQQLVAAGVSPADARAEALRQFGNLEAVRAACLVNDQQRVRTMRFRAWISEFRQDVAFAIRTLGRNPGFAAVVILSLTLGIGANAAIFTVVDALMLRRLPVQRPAELVVIGDPSRVNSFASTTNPRTDLYSYQAYLAVRDNAKTMTSVLATGRSGRLDVRIDTTAGAATDHPRGRFVSGNYFSTLGVGAQRGRMFAATEDAALGAAPVAVISDRYWTEKFGRDPAVVNRTVSVNGTGITIVGIAPPGFTGEIVGQPIAMWLPITMQPIITGRGGALAEMQQQWLILMGRLAPGRSVESVSAELKPLLQRTYLTRGLDGVTVTQAQADALEMRVFDGSLGLSYTRSLLRTPLFTLIVGVGLLLLIICANVANLLLARSVARGREMSVRLAMGAGRGRVTRQMITESIVLMTAGVAGGLAAAWVSSKLLISLAASGGIPVEIDTRFSGPVLAFTLAVAALSVLLFGLAPALRATRVDLSSALRSGARALSGGMGRGARPTGGALLVAAQVALSLVLLVGASVLVRHLHAISTADAGLDRDHLVIAEVDAVRGGYTGARLDALIDRLSAQVAAVPGVVGVTYSENGIFSGTESANTLSVPGFVPATTNDSVAFYDQVGPGYATIIGATIVAGRDIAPNDLQGTQPVALINETMAKFFFRDRGTEPLGGTLLIDGTPPTTVVGIIADTKDHDLTSAPVRRFYAALRQRTTGEAESLRLEIRSSVDPAALVDPIRKAITAAYPTLAVSEVRPLAVMMQESVRSQWLLSRLATGFGVMALALCALGLYGILSYAIARRTGELGVRMALGASRGGVVRLVLGDAARVVTIGAVVGIPLAVFAQRTLRGTLEGAAPADRLSLVAGVAVMAAAALAAAMIPALRASRVDPAVALRQD
jgi:predicted permease